MRTELSLPASWRDEDVEALHLASLRRHIGYVLERSPYYRRTLDGLRIEDVQSPDRLRQLPSRATTTWKRTTTNSSAYPSARWWTM